jgi:hypothetical protein
MCKYKPSLRAEIAYIIAKIPGAWNNGCFVAADEIIELIEKKRIKKCPSK